MMQKLILATVHPGMTTDEHLLNQAAASYNDQDYQQATKIWNTLAE